MTNTQETEDFFLSIAIPTWNRYEDVVKAVESVGLEKYHDIELVIVDNHSEKYFWDKIYFKYKNHRQVKLYRNEKNIGMTPNWNKALGLCRGAWLSLLCSDDVFIEDGFQKAYELLKSIKKPMLVIQNPTLQKNTILKAGVEASRGINLPIMSGNFVHCNCINKLGMFNENLKYSPDGEYWIRIATKFPVLMCAQNFAKYHSHQDNYAWHTWLKDDVVEQMIAIEELRNHYKQKVENIDKSKMEWEYFLFFVKNSIGKAEHKDIVLKYLPILKKNMNSVKRKKQMVTVYLIYFFRSLVPKFLQKIIKNLWLKL